MITVLQRKNGKAVDLKLSEVKTKKGLWVDCQEPTAEELKKVGKLFNIPYSELREHLQKYERPSTYEFGDYSLVVVGVPLHESKMTRSSVAVFFHPNKNVLTLRMRKVSAIDMLKQELLEKNPDFLKTPVSLLRRLLERVIDDYFEQQDMFQETADHIETKVLHGSDKNITEKIFKLKKQLLFSHKTLVANREVVLSVEKGRLGKISKQESYEFRDIYNDIVQLIDANDTLRDVVTGVIDIYMSSVSNQLNKVMKKLTVMASYVLIPTLIASIYGMNFDFMPEIPWKWGYTFALGLMGLSVLALYIYFKKVKWL